MRSETDLADAMSCAAARADALALAEARYRTGDYAAALGSAMQLAESAESAPAALALAGLCQLRLGAAQEALALLGRAASLAPGDQLIRLRLGIGLQAVGRHAEAIPCFRDCTLALPLDPAPWLNLASSLLALGDATGARRAARRARLRGPRLPQAHYVLGLTLLAADHVTAAEAAFRQATRLDPGFAEAWVNLGVARYRNGAIEPAKQAMRQALAFDPGHRAATANLAVFLRLTGYPEQSESLLRNLLDRDPRAHAARVNLAAYLLTEDRDAEALSLLDGEEPDEPQLRRHWLLQRALGEVRIGRIDVVATTLDRIDAADTATKVMLAWRRTLLAEARRQPAVAAQAAEEAERTLAGESAMLPEHRLIAHYDLAGFYSHRAEPERAFAHWIAGHRELARFQPFTRARVAEFVDATIERFSAEHLAHTAKQGIADERPVFVMGMPRSGTTLTEQILAAHGQVHGAGERADLDRTFARLAGDSESAAAVVRLAGLPQPILDDAARSYLADLGALAPGAARVVDKMPENFRLLGLVARMLPGARVIWCLRDPRDVGFSIFTYRFYGYHPYAHDLGDLGWYIGQHYRLLHHWREALPNPLLVVRLTDWVFDFDTTLRRVTDFLGLRYDPACERFFAFDRPVRTASRHQVRQPINARGIGRWHRYERQLAPLIDALNDAGASAYFD